MTLINMKREGGLPKSTKLLAIFTQNEFAPGILLLHRTRAGILLGWEASFWIHSPVLG